MAEIERREHERIDMSCPCKVYDPRSRRYLAGLTWNLSPAGAMFEVARPLDLAPGDPLYIGIALKRRQTVLPAREMLPCRVTRALRTTTEYTAVAVAFDRPVNELTAAERLAA